MAFKPNKVTLAYASKSKFIQELEKVKINRNLLILLKYYLKIIILTNPNKEIQHKKSIKQL